MAGEHDRNSQEEPRTGPPPGAELTAREKLAARFRRARGRGWLMTAAAIAGFGLLVYLLWPAKKASSEEEKADIKVSVRVATAERGSIASEVTAIGTIVPRLEATVGAKINAQIKTMPLLKNKPVKAGDVVATLESRDLQAQRAEAASALEEAQASARLLSTGTIPEANSQDEKALRDARASVANARATYERRLVLFENGGISKKDLEASQLALTTAENDLRAAETASRLHQTASNPNSRAAAESRVKQAQDHLASLDTQLSYATIRAPFSGVITDQFQFQGEYAAAGAKLFSIADVSEVIVKAPVSDTVAADLKVGDRATVLPQEQPDTKLESTISLISRASDPQSRSVEVWISLKNEGGRLRAASAAKVVLTTNSANDVVVVPTAAVTLKAANAGEGTVMVVVTDGDEKIAYERKVTIGIRSADQMEITSGLKGGETVVVEGNYALPDKTKVVEVKGASDEESGDEGGDNEGGGEKGSAPEGGTPPEQTAKPDSGSSTSNSAAGTGDKTQTKGSRPSGNPAPKGGPRPAGGSKSGDGQPGKQSGVKP